MFLTTLLSASFAAVGLPSRFFGAIDHVEICIGAATSFKVALVNVSSPPSRRSSPARNADKCVGAIAATISAKTPRARKEALLEYF